LGADCSSSNSCQCIRGWSGYVGLVHERAGASLFNYVIHSLYCNAVTRYIMPSEVPGNGKNASRWLTRMIPNSTILPNDTNPRLPTVVELRTPSTRAKWIWAQKRGLLFLPNGEFIETVRFPQHLDLRLADPDPSSHDFYLVSRSPHLMGGGPLGSFGHWSVYCQGHFYHLSAPNLPREFLKKSQNHSSANDVRCRLRHEDLSSPDSADYRRFVDSTVQKPMTAYKVGQTDYSPDQLLCLANWIINRLPVYSLFTANCQHFAKTLAYRSVMRLSDRSTFIGNPTQIVDWDLGDKNEPHINCIEQGFLTGRPRPSGFTRIVQCSSCLSVLSLFKSSTRLHMVHVSSMCVQLFL